MLLVQPSVWPLFHIMVLKLPARPVSKDNKILKNLSWEGAFQFDAKTEH